MHDPATYMDLGDWREGLWTTYARLESRSDEEEFYGRIAEAFPGSHLLTEVMSTRQETERTEGNIRHDPSEWLLVALQIEGTGHADQSGRCAATRPGQFTIYETTRPYRLGFAGPFRQLVTRLPREMVLRRLPNLCSLTGRSYDGTSGTGAVFSRFVRELSDEAEALEGSTGADFNETLVELLSTTLRLLTQGEDDADARRYRALTGALEAHVQAHDFDLVTFAASQGLSPRSLQRVFHAQGTTPLRWLAERRLEGAAADLAQPTQPRRRMKSVTEISLDWGFGDLSHFSTSFRGRYGMSPRAWRRKHLG